ncbi:CaiB/BaiF CoA transferase family protein [Maricaulis salignorans]|uniref:Crotonobetainyl-CoA:carnitine CoA-transferase CaiB n=1 Tax=Maricaulis salignorans TaxID=144026 RepID=A0A1G9LRT2_9PROT|nr:CoA transferase [Maricaulis salignorans]SDL64484.1 Crotonobetainyl-CoA:carnitine CoA-transferase CaiB [Maricaulis salignorans]
MNPVPQNPDSFPAPLRGIRVLDLGMLLPGPVCALHLAWFGADVIKVEPTTGDPGRDLYDGAFFDTYNRGKRSIALDLKSEDGRAVMRKLIAEADVLVENFRPGVATRLGVDADTATRENARLIYCSINGYGSGAEATRPAHDLNFLARSGAMGAATTWSGQGRAPVRPAMPVADMGGAAMATQAILAALFQRERTGRGARIEIPMIDVMMHWMAWRVAAEDRADPDAWTRYLEPANDIYKTADGRHIVIGAIEAHLWKKLVDLLDAARPGWFADAGVADWGWQDRRAAAAPLGEALSHAFLSRTSDDWVTSATTAGIPLERVDTPAEAFAQLSASERGMISADGWIRPPLPGLPTLGAAPHLNADGDSIRSGNIWVTDDR